MSAFIFGTRDENRTRTGLLPRDFKSLASTSSATRASRPILVNLCGLSTANRAEDGVIRLALGKILNEAPLQAVDAFCIAQNTAAAPANVNQSNGNLYCPNSR